MRVYLQDKLCGTWLSSGYRFFNDDKVKIRALFVVKSVVIHAKLVAFLQLDTIYYICAMKTEVRVCIELPLKSY